MSIPTPEEVTRTAQAILTDGPLPLPDLVERLDAKGLMSGLRDDGIGDDELSSVLIEELLGDDVWLTPDDRVFSSAPLTDGMVLTHRLSEEELDTGLVGFEPDLVAVDWAAPHGLELEGLEPPGGKGRLVDRSGSLDGPDGWLAPFRAGDVVAFRRRGLSVEIFAATELADGQPEVDGLRDTIAGRIRVGEGAEALPFLMDALAADAKAFRRPVPPLGELLERAGLERRGFAFGRQGEPWFTLHERFRQGRRQELADAWDFDTCCRRAFDEVDAAFALFVADPQTEIDAAAVNRNLGHSAVGLAFAEYLQSARPDEQARVIDFATTVAERSPDGAAPAWLLAASAADSEGDVVTAEAHVHKALGLDPDYGPAAATLSRYQIDRSDVTGAIVSLRHPDLDPEGPVLAFLLDLDRPYRQAGRNQPCPCGSGQKFKQCCARHRSVPLAGRTALLSFKLALFASRPEHQGIRLSLADAALDPEDPEPDATFDRLAADSMIIDLALWEGGLAARYLAERGGLLPPDERELLSRFLDDPRRLWEITAVDEGSRLDLRDIRTGDAVSVDEHVGSIGRQPGELILARVARLDQVSQILGSVMDVPLGLRDSLTGLLDDDADAIAMATWYGEATSAAAAPGAGSGGDGD